MDDQKNSTKHLLLQLNGPQFSLQKIMRAFQQIAHTMSSEHFALLLGTIISSQLIEQTGANTVFSRLYFGFEGTGYELELNVNQPGYDSVIEQLANGACGTYVIPANLVNTNFYLITSWGNTANFYRAAGQKAIKEVERCVMRMMHDTYDNHNNVLEKIGLSGNLWLYLIAGLVSVVILSKLFTYCLTMLRRMKEVIIEHYQTAQKSNAVENEVELGVVDVPSPESCNNNIQPAVIYKKF